MTIDTIMNPRTPSATDIKRGLAVLMAVAETVRGAGSIPAGTMYALLIGSVDLAGFESLVRTLVGAGLVSEQDHLLTWIGPQLEVQ